MTTKELISTIKRYINSHKDNRFKKMAKGYRIGRDFRRIYHYHIRKTGGTSLNYMFLSLGGEEGRTVYDRLSSSPHLRTISNEKICVGWDREKIERGHYFYAFSHTPAHEICLPEKTFTLTCLRDPVKRVISLYKMLFEYRKDKIEHPIMKEQGEWLGNSFGDFIDRTPKEHLLRQLYMFSRSFSIEESYEKITNCSHFLLTETFDESVGKLAEKLSIQLSAIHTRKSSIDVAITNKEIERLRSLLEPEYVLYERLIKHQNHRS